MLFVFLGEVIVGPKVLIFLFRKSNTRIRSPLPLSTMTDAWRQNKGQYTPLSADASQQDTPHGYNPPNYYATDAYSPQPSAPSAVLADDKGYGYLLSYSICVIFFPIYDSCNLVVWRVVGCFLLVMLRCIARRGCGVGGWGVRVWEGGRWRMEGRRVEGQRVEV